MARLPESCASAVAAASVQSRMALVTGGKRPMRMVAAAASSRPSLGAAADAHRGRIVLGGWRMYM